MADLPNPPLALTPPKQMSRHVFALLALVFLAAAVGLWYWFNRTKVESLRLGAGMELRYKDGLTDILCDEAQRKHLNVEVQWTHQPTEAVESVSKHELDAAIIPAGLSMKADVRQVTMMDPQILHLFVKPELAPQGLDGLRGHTVFLGTPGSGVRCVAEEILKFAGLAAGKEFVEDPRPYDALLKPGAGAMPDAVFSLSPLPSPLGEKLVHQCGYQLMELPMGESLALRKPSFEDAVIPSDTYGAAPAVPPRQLHTIGVRGVLIANAAVPSLAVERLLEVLYESDFSRRANLKKMDPALLQRGGDYRFHDGTTAYIHRGDPWHVKELLAKVQGLIGSTVSAFSAILLAWHWIRRKKVDVGEYQQQCTNIDLDAQRAACLGEFGDAELGICLTQLAKLKTEVLEQHHVRYMSGDKAIVEVVQRVEELQHLLPSLVRTKVPAKRMQLDFGPPPRRAA
jgi:TRAP-type uncharacterized transport system substrate-binding protein